MRSTISLRIYILFLAGMLVCHMAKAEQAGRVQFVTGAVQVTTAAGATHELQKGQAVNEGDTLVSGKSSSAQIKMQDGGFIAVRPDTQLKFDSFKFNGKADGSEQGFFSLLKGGFRAITGLIGRVNKQNYRITTPAATIGIRGTDHETIVLTADNPLVLSGAAEAGTYNKVNMGETTLTTGAGTVSVPLNRMGFAPGMDQLPKVTLVDPRIFNMSPSNPARSEKGNRVDHDGEQKKRGSADGVPDKGVDGQPLLTQECPTCKPPQPPIICVTCPLPPLPPPPVLISQPAQTVQGNMAVVFCNPTCVNGFADAMKGVVDANGALIGFNTSAGMSGGLGGAKIVQPGRAALASGGNLNWGEWAAGPTTISAPSGFAGGVIATQAITSLHYIGGDAPSMMPTGTIDINYVPIGGTSPTDGAGNVGKFLSGSVAVNFGASTVQVMNLMIGMGANIFDMKGVAPSAFSTTTGLLTPGVLTGICSTCAITSASGNYTGVLVGAGAAGLGLGYSVKGSIDAGKTVSISGVEAFSK